MSTTTARDHLADAAGILLAAAAGDDDAVDALMTSLLDARDWAEALLTLKGTLSAATMALQAEALRAREAGEDSEAFRVLAALTRTSRDER